MGGGGEAVTAEGDGERGQEGRNVEGGFLCLGRREGRVDRKESGNGEGEGGGCRGRQGGWTGRRGHRLCRAWVDIGYI